ncbi:MAG: hypothetical protein H6722_11555 [Sandaracinus sp.]|nr:hypothetical protein [Sandaracinus sp.]MCB9624628.1 hypothetical protein [Sandaracinus sp.]
MAFRDDRDALRAKQEQLQGELEEAKSKLDAHERKDVHDEAELARLRKEVERLRRAAGRSSGTATPSRAPALLAAVVGLVVALGIGGFLAFSTRQGPPSVSVAPATPMPAMPAMPAVPAPPPIPRAEESPTETEPVAVRFGAVVTTSVGRPDVPVGTGCVIETQLGLDDVRALAVRCPAGLVYDPSEELGASMTMSSSREAPRNTAAGLVHLVSFSESGQRSGPRAQIDLNTQAGVLRVWRDGGSPFDLRFATEDRASEDGIEPEAPRTQAPQARWLLAATLRSHEGPLPFTERSCELALLPESLGSGHTCRARLRCGDVLVYGAGTSGYNHCETLITGGRAYPRADDRRISSEDTDPRFELDLSTHVVTAADANATGAWEARFALAPSDRCDFDGTWAADDGGLPFRLVGDRRGLRAEGLHEGEARAELRCEHGEASLTLVDGVQLDGRFGPDFATFLAVDAEGAPYTFLRVAR